MNTIKNFLKSMCKIARKFDEDHQNTDVMDQDSLIPRKFAVAALETKEQLQDDYYDKKLIENVDRVTPFLRKEKSGNHSSTEQQRRK
jgi:hypothetical protein